MWVCETCGESFTEPKRIPFYREYFDGCPYCHSLLITQNASQCKMCECWYKDEDMFVVAGICRDCLFEILKERNDILIKYAMEDIDAFAEFAAEKLEEDKKMPQSATTL